MKIVLFILLSMLIFTFSATSQNLEKIFLESERKIPEDKSWLEIIEFLDTNHLFLSKQKLDSLSKYYLKKKNYQDYLFINNEFCFRNYQAYKDTSVCVILQDAVKKVENRKKRPETELSLSYYLLARFHDSDKKYEWYQRFFEEASQEKTPALYHLASMYMGAESFILGNYETAWERLQYCFDHTETSQSIADFYFIIGKTIGETDNELSTILLKKALKEYKKESKFDAEFEFKCLKELTNIYTKRIEEEAALNYGQKALVILEDSSNHIIEKDATKTIYHLLAELETWVYKFDKADEYIKSYNENKKKYVNPEYVNPLTCMLKGLSYYYQEHADSAAIYFQLAIDGFTEAESDLCRESVLSYGYLAYIFNAKGNNIKAIELYENVLKILSKENYSSVKDSFKLVPPKNIGRSRDFSDFYFSIIDIMSFYMDMYSQNPQPEILKKVEELSNYNDQIIKEWFRNTATEKSVLQASKLIKLNNSYRIDVAYRYSKNNPSYIDSAFIYADEANSFNLNYLKQIKLRSFSSKEDSLMNRISKLNIEILNLGNIERETIDSVVNLKVDLLKTKVLLSELSTADLNIINIKPNVDYIKESLSDQEAILKIYINNEQVYSICYTSNKSSFQKIHFPEFAKSVKKINYSIKSGSKDYTYQDLFYTKLIKPFEEQLSGKEQLYIIADEKLGELPFELFTDDNHKYLVEKSAINYYYSAKNINLKSYSLPDNFFAIAPGFEKNKNFCSQNITREAMRSLDIFAKDHDRSMLVPLAHSIEEVNEIDNLFTGKNISSKILTGDQALENQFKKNYENKKLIHIATHSISNNPYESGLFFTYTANGDDDGFLRLPELYQMNFNADLVVLSACKTGTGEILDGEGVMALPRGFIYAGVPNVIASLWKVHDKKTKDLMVAFYKHLLEGKVSYAEALRLAKLDCIEKGFLPLDWAGFILIGE